MLPKLKYSTKFGPIESDELGKITYTPTLGDKATVADWILRHSGLQKTLYNMQLLINAISKDPLNRERYVLWKRQHLGQIAENATNLFRMEFKRFLESGAPENIARSKAMKAAEEYKKKMLESHNKQFPDEFTYEQAVKLLRFDKGDKKNSD